MAFTAKDVQALREMTGVGMMDCKKALMETDGDIDAAVKHLREKGLAAAAKKAGRVAAEGLVWACVDEATGVGAVVEVNSETDFVAKNEDFQQFVKNITQVVSATNPADMPALMAAAYPGGTTVEEAQRDKVLSIGENIQIRRFARYESGVSVAYVHMGGKIGVLVNMEVSDELKQNPAVMELGKDIAMQIAAMRPKFLAPGDVDEATIEAERQILLAQIKEEGKPEAVAEKIVAGRIGKYYEENCLLKQAFVKENKVSVESYVARVAKELSGSITIGGFTRFEKGEGIEKRVDNLAEEVAKMVQ